MKAGFGYLVTQISARRAEQIYGWIGEDAAAANRESHATAEDGSVHVPIRFAGGDARIFFEDRPADSGSVMVELDLPGQKPLPLFPSEAAALGQALIDIAADLAQPGEGAIEMADLPEAIRAAQRFERSRDD
ncbi:hypothetical protein [Leucobacter chromiireducens]|uniref:hypothetical protein n=1 Tax=Leucobacter chromiireducens TaxID=283877 RepID=UPI000F640DC7|nr:hypothetical protein [Leucobacter chromiireducens]